MNISFAESTEIPPDTLVIHFKPGWNIFSSNVLPDSSDVKFNFQPLIDSVKLIKIQDENGNALEDYGMFGGWTNNIGEISLSEGYKAKVTDTCQLIITGKGAVLPYNIPLKSGWNIMSYPQYEEMNALAIIKQSVNTGNIIKVQDEQGNAIEDYGVFGGWMNNIGHFKPGYGYKIKVLSNDTLNVPKNRVDIFTDQRDGNMYKTVKIGDQTWMAENLKATKFNDGEDIPLVTDSAAWFNLTTPGYCWYDNEETRYKNIYGGLYNWYAVNTGKLCPEGWHMPSMLEWDLLESYLIANGYNYDGTTTYNLIAKSLAATTNWSGKIMTGTPSNNRLSNNQSGFSALPGGLRYCFNNINFKYIEISCEFWSGSEIDTSTAAGFQIFSNGASLYQYEEPKNGGFSVRCVRYPESFFSVVTALPELLTYNSVTLGGDVISGGGSSVIEKGICYNTTQNPTVGDSKVAGGSGTGYFKVNVTGLTPYTTYYARAYALGNQGTVYGNEISFTTTNKYDGVYSVTAVSPMVDILNANLTGYYPFTFELRTSGPNSCKCYDSEVYYDYYHPILSSGKLSGYGSFGLEIFFDPVTDKIIEVRNPWGNPPANTRMPAIDPSGANLWDSVTRNIDFKYWMKQPSLVPDPPNIRVYFDEKWIYKGPRD